MDMQVKNKQLDSDAKTITHNNTSWGNEILNISLHCLSDIFSDTAYLYNIINNTGTQTKKTATQTALFNWHCMINTGTLASYVFVTSLKEKRHIPCFSYPQRLSFGDLDRPGVTLKMLVKQKLVPAVLFGNITVSVRMSNTSTEDICFKSVFTAV